MVNKPISEAKPTRSDRELKEKQFQKMFEELCHTFGWVVAHFRPARKADGSWVTAVSGDGKGFPDNVAAKPGHQLIFCELKREGQKLSPAQVIWFEILNQVPGVRAYVFYPHDFTRIATILAEPEEVEKL